MIAVLEVRPLPFFPSERAKNGVHMSRIGLLTEMILKASHFVLQSSFRVSEAREAKRERVLPEQGIPERTRCLSIVAEESLRPLKQVLGRGTWKIESSGRAFKGPEEVLNHMLCGHLAPQGQSILSEASDASNEMLIEECFSKLVIIDVKRNCSHARMRSSSMNRRSDHVMMTILIAINQMALPARPILRRRPGRVFMASESFEGLWRDERQDILSAAGAASGSKASTDSNQMQTGKNAC